MSDDRIARFARRLLERLPPNARVLEIGCGEGALATALQNAGHRVTAIERRPRGAFPAIEGDFATYGFGERRFDCIVAMLVLHHAADLPAMLDKIAGLLAPNGFVAFDDYGWERHPDPDAAWKADRQDLLTSATVLDALDARFERIAYEDHAYLDDGRGSDAMAFTFFGRLRRAAASSF